MGKLDNKLYKLQTKINHGYWQDRATAQIQFGLQLSGIRDGRYDAIIEKAEDFLLEKLAEDKCVSKEAAQQAEEMLAPLSADAKSFTLHCVSHAHIDMNWMWRFDETVTVSLDTFRTMLDLLKEYPQFTFSQSQASVYKIVEEYGPAGMLDEIRRYVKEGRWEVTANTWVEADKNMPNGESMARHLLYTRRYLSKLLDIPMDSIRMDFEPDTFGHSANVPEVLADAGVEYYYHCRGSHDPQLIWWKAPSGAKVLSFRDVAGYNAVVDPSFAVQMLTPCKELGIDTMLKVYGVGDHGGGPSRRDIERIIDMQSWTVYPTILFSTYHAFFDAIKAKYGDKLPVRDTEMNAVFTGCYTTQTRIKMANRVGEATLHEAEMFGAAANTLAQHPYPAVRYEQAWEKLLFNQFHDILTGSGVIDTREYAMGQFQQCFATANTEKLNAMRAISAQVDTSCYKTEESLAEYRTDGAGVGRGVADFKISQVGRGDGAVRVYQIFNPSPYEREELVEITVWDWSNDELPLIEFRDEAGNVVPHQLVKSGTEWYWFHEFMIALVRVKVPACGYATYTLRKSEDTVTPMVIGEPGEWQQVEVPHFYQLENDKVQITFDLQTAAVTSFVDKSTGKEMLSQDEFCGFRLIEEDVERGMTSWRVGRHMNIKEFGDVHIRPVRYSGASLRQALEMEFGWSRSHFKALIYLDEHTGDLMLDTQCDWHEVGKPGDRMPQLNFVVPLSFASPSYRFDIPGGTLVRKAENLDLPATSFIAAMPEQGGATLMLSTDNKYGYRGFEDAMAVTLIRSSYDPDPYPEYGVHKTKIALSLIDSGDTGAMVQHAFALCHPLNALPASIHEGTLPRQMSFLSMDNQDIALQAVKLAEDGSGAWIVRLADMAGKGGNVHLQLAKAPKSACLVDINEKETAGNVMATDNGLTLDVAPGRMVSIKIVL